MDFQRARSQEQRETRRRSISETALQMLGEMPVAELSLNELSRRVGLAKSNVLRYFDSREAVLLDLLDQQVAAWVSVVAEELPSAVERRDLRQRTDAVAGVLAESLAGRAILCDLISSQAAVLERNVSVDSVLEHKQRIAGSVSELSTALTAALPELSEGEAYEAIVITFFSAAAAWPAACLPASVEAAYAQEPSLAAGRIDFHDHLRRTLELVLSGLLARRAHD